MPHTGTDKTFGGCKKEGCGEEHVGLRGVGEIYGRRIEIKGDREDDNQSDGVRPDVDRLVGEVERRFDAIELVV